MKGFRNTTKTVSGHHNVRPEQFHTFGRERLATGGLINKLARGGQPGVHGLHETREVPDKYVYGEDHALVHRRVPSTGAEEEAGGKSPLMPGYKGGGKARHFHVHKHYYQGGRVVKSEHKSYGGAPKGKQAPLAGRAGKMQGSKRFTNHRSAGGFGTAGGRPGPTRKRLAEGGHCETGETRNKLAKGGMHIKPENRGKFTKKMTGSKHGKLTGSDVQRGLHSKSAETRKEANFARMARRGFKPLAKGGHIHDNTKVIAPNYAAGGALYARGGEVGNMRKVAHQVVGEHIKHKAPQGHSGLGALMRHEKSE